MSPNGLGQRLRRSIARKSTHGCDRRVAHLVTKRVDSPIAHSSHAARSNRPPLLQIRVEGAIHEAKGSDCRGASRLPTHRRVRQLGYATLRTEILGGGAVNHES